MLKVGLTGGIGSGKSLICEIFSHLGAPIYNADVVARIFMEEDTEVKTKIIQQFGKQSYTSNGLNRTYLRETIFTDKNALAAIDSIVHPIVMNDFLMWCGQHMSKPYVILEAALIFEANMKHLLDRIIVITAPESLRIQRVVKRDKVTKETVNAILLNQLSEPMLVNNADEVVVNDDKTLLLPQIVAIHKKLKKTA